MSLMRPDTVGSIASSSRVTDVAAPVRVELKTGLVSPMTVTVSATFASVSVNATSCATPSVSERLFCASGRNPERAAVIV